MTAATRSGLLLAATLLLGIVLGAAGMGALQRRRRAELGGLGRPPGFARHVTEVIGPRDSAQAARLEPAIARAAARNERIIRAANAGLRGSLDSMRTELAPLLDEAQRERLERMTRLPPPFGPRPFPRGMRGPRPEGPPPEGPPPGGPPPDGPPAGDQ